MHCQSFKFIQLCLWTTIISVLPLFPSFHRIPWLPVGNVVAIVLLTLVVMSSLLCAFGISKTFVAPQYQMQSREDNTTKQWLRQQRLLELNTKRDKDMSPKQRLNVEKKKRRIRRQIEIAERPKKTPNKYAPLYMCVPFLVVYPAVFVNVGGCVAYALFLDAEPMRVERAIIAVLICVWGVITPCLYAPLLSLFCKELCVKKLRCACAASDESLTHADVANVMEVDAAYFNQKIDRDDLRYSFRGVLVDRPAAPHRHPHRNYTEV